MTECNSLYNRCGIHQELNAGVIGHNCLLYIIDNISALGCGICSSDPRSDHIEYFHHPLAPSTRKFHHPFLFSSLFFLLSSISLFFLPFSVYFLSLFINIFIYMCLFSSLSFFFQILFEIKNECGKQRQKSKSNFNKKLECQTLYIFIIEFFVKSFK